MRRYGTVVVVVAQGGLFAASQAPVFDTPLAPQQLVSVLQQASPPSGATQCVQSNFVEHLSVPSDFFRQQTTNPGLPQVDRAAQLTTLPRQLWLTSVVLAWSDAQLTYSPCVVAPTQLQFAAMSACAAAMSPTSAPVGSHMARLDPVAVKKNATPRTPRMSIRMVVPSC